MKTSSGKFSWVLLISIFSYHAVASSQGSSCFVQRFPTSARSVDAVDMLFVLDTSDTTLAQKTAIAQSFDELVQGLPAGTDYQVGLLLGHGSKSPYCGRLWHDWDETAVLRSAQLSVSQIEKRFLEYLEQAPQDSMGGREGLFSLSRALEGEHFESIRRQGFFRSNAALVVVFISKNADACAVNKSQSKFHTPNTRDCAPVHGALGVNDSTVFAQLKAVQQANPLIVSGVLRPNSDGYNDLIRDGGGFFIDITLDHLATGFNQLGLLIAQSIQPVLDFPLMNSPVNPSSITVNVMDIHDSSRPRGDGRSDDFWDVDEHGCRHTRARSVGLVSMPAGAPAATVVSFTYSASTNSVDVPDSAIVPGHCGYEDPHRSGDWDREWDHDRDHDNHFNPGCGQKIVEISYCLAKPSPSPTVSVTPTPTPTVSVTPTPTPTVSVTPTPTPTVSVTPTPTPTVSVTPTPTPSVCTGPFCGGGLGN